MAGDIKVKNKKTGDKRTFTQAAWVLLDQTKYEVLSGEIEGGEDKASTKKKAAEPAEGDNKK